MYSDAEYRVYFTRNSEYHLRNHVCVAVRDRRTGQWFEEHPALSRPLAAALRFADQFATLHTPNLGESLDFAQDHDGEPLRTSPVLSIENRAPNANSSTSRSSTSTRPAAHKSAKAAPMKTGQMRPVAR
jgi:hypothetical protein